MFLWKMFHRVFVIFQVAYTLASRLWQYSMLEFNANSMQFKFKFNINVDIALCVGKTCVTELETSTF